MGNILETLRFDYPRIWRLLLCSFFLVGGLIIFASLPSSPLLRAIGITHAQERLHSLYYAGYWYARSHTNEDFVPVSRTAYGNLIGLDKSGLLVISVPEGDKFVAARVRIADVTLQDLYGAAVLIAQLGNEDVKFDIYGDDLAVIWIRGAPLNVKLIEAGHAVPDPNPPTNIVDKAFAAYYWRNFNGE